ncbi:MAG: type II toxin-antitoxin system VapB family antitoxin [Firmicutes bacterium]|nr:type II toxin-antitoxin system VapB family antitoxin [Bacillota bacterium]HPU02010.1 type II toxin-antitoxin system VapB family antitoxin [Bacillota bacterium]
MRTNIVIDDKLMEQAMRLSGLSTKKEVVERALREFVERHSRKDLLELRGKILFDSNYDYKAKRERR